MKKNIFVLFLILFTQAFCFVVDDSPRSFQIEMNKDYYRNGAIANLNMVKGYLSLIQKNSKNYQEVEDLVCLAMKHIVSIEAFIHPVKPEDGP